METSNIKTQDRNLNRLLKLYDGLIKMDKNNPYKVFTASSGDTVIEHYNWLLELIPNCGSRFDNSHKKNHVIFDIANYYSLSFEQTTHLFVPYSQDPAYNGTILGLTARPKQVAHNVLEFVKVMDAESRVPVTELYPKKRGKKQRTFKKYQHEEEVYSQAGA